MVPDYIIDYITHLGKSVCHGSALNTACQNGRTAAALIMAIALGVRKLAWNGTSHYIWPFGVIGTVY